MSAESGAERRQYTRVPFQADATVHQESSAFNAQLIDVSLNGLLIKTPEVYHIRTDIPCRVLIRLTHDIEIQMQVALVHSGSSLLGFHCTSIDMDSLAHLRRVIEMNIDDPMAAERVLAELVKRQKEL